MVLPEFDFFWYLSNVNQWTLTISTYNMKNLYTITSMRIWGKSMNKKILMGSMLVLTLLLLMPSIPAIQQKVVKDEVFSEIQEDIEFEDVKELLESGKLGNEKFPLLYSLVYYLTRFRLWRFDILAEISYDVYCGEGWFDLDIHNLLLFSRCVMILLSTFFIIGFFNDMSDSLGWNWEIPY